MISCFCVCDMVSTDLIDMNLSKPQEIMEDGGAWRATVHGVENDQTQLSN